MQAFEQPLAVQPQIQRLGIDHDAVKKSIHRRAQGGQRLQRSSIVAHLKLGQGLGRDLLHGSVERNFSRFGQQHGAHVGIHLGHFFQNVADALVGSRQCRRLGQGGKGAHRRQSLAHITQALRTQGQHGIHLLRAVALIAQGTGQALVNKVLQLGQNWRALFQATAPA